MPETIYTAYCPRCDRPKTSKKSFRHAVEIVANHVDQAHPDMENWIREELNDEKSEGISTLIKRRT